MSDSKPGSAPTSASAKRSPEPWQCEECGCQSRAFMDERQPDGSFARGRSFRCVNCKRETIVRSPEPTPEVANVIHECQAVDNEFENVADPKWSHLKDALRRAADALAAAEARASALDMQNGHLLQALRENKDTAELLRGAEARARTAEEERDEANEDFKDEHKLRLTLHDENKALRAANARLEQALREMLEHCDGRPDSHFGWFTGKTLQIGNKQIEQWREAIAAPSERQPENPADRAFLESSVEGHKRNFPDTRPERQPARPQSEGGSEAEER